MLTIMGLALSVNGEMAVVAEVEELSVEAFVQRQGLRADRVAVERNGAIVPRPQWASTLLQSGDRLEVVHFVGGGAPVRSLRRASQRSPYRFQPPRW